MTVGRLSRPLLLGALLVLVSGCGVLQSGNGGPDPFSSGPRSGNGVFELEVRNDHFNDARVFVHWGGVRRRLGLVTGTTTQTFQVEWQSQDFRVEVDLIAGSGFTTDVLTVWPGEEYELRIPSHL